MLLKFCTYEILVNSQYDPYEGTILTKRRFLDAEYAKKIVLLTTTRLVCMFPL